MVNGVLVDDIIPKREVNALLFESPMKIKLCELKTGSELDTTEDRKEEDP